MNATNMFTYDEETTYYTGISENININFAKVADVKSPVRGTEKSAGLDFFIPNDWNDGDDYIVAAHEQIIIPSGIHIDMVGSGLDNYMMVFQNKSGVATKRHLIVGAEIIDADYEGQLHINLHNIGKDAVKISPGDKIIQGIIMAVIYADPYEFELTDLYKNNSTRGTGGFGSTGDK